MTDLPPKNPNLRAVGPDEVAPTLPKVPETIAEAIEGSGRDVLATMRKALAQKLDDDKIASNAITSAYTKLEELDRRIRQLDRAKREEAAEDSDVDDRFNADAI